MKFTSILVAFVATTAAIQIETPKESYAAKAANLAEGLAVNVAQHAFEMQHVRNHTAAMKLADEEQAAVQQHMRTARIDSLKTTFMKE